MESTESNWFLDNLKLVDLTSYFLFGKINVSEWSPNFDKNEIIKYWKG
ncbi:hypothetical protein [Flavobacterium sp. UBA7682]|nr:hypothetical protein [Flavobacterium sp. UBA7682]